MQKVIIPASAKPQSMDSGDDGDIINLESTENVSDGFHTFGELYSHRYALFIALMKSNPTISWRATHHDDGSGYDGYFVAGMVLPTGNISYHLPLSLWELLDGCCIVTAARAPEFDGHTSGDVLERLMAWSMGLELTQEHKNFVAVIPTFMEN